VAEKVLAWLHHAAVAAEAAAGAGAGAGGAGGGDEAAAADAAGAAQTLDALQQLLGGLLDVIEPQLFDYATDKHATHVVRALLVVLVGRDMLTPPGKKQQQQAQQARQQQQQQQDGGQEEGQAGSGHPYIQVCVLFMWGGRGGCGGWWCCLTVSVCVWWWCERMCRQAGGA
jgi:hypothetical protein